MKLFLDAKGLGIRDLRRNSMVASLAPGRTRLIAKRVPRDGLSDGVRHDRWRNFSRASVSHGLLAIFNH
jgi:hypothetical protein